jgi:hypothetical protein
MVAIATLPRTVASPTTPFPARRPPVGDPGRAARPALTLVPAHVGHRRRVVGLLVGALLALAVVLAAGYLVRTPPTAAPATTTHVVAEGESLWSIAVAHAPAGEAAGYVEQLVAANGTATVATGQTITLPQP